MRRAGRRFSAPGPVVPSAYNPAGVSPTVGIRESLGAPKRLPARHLSSRAKVELLA
jgi:hypothetical protein